MAFGFYSGMGLSEFYNVLSMNLLILSLLLGIIFLLAKLEFFSKISKNLIKFLERHRKKISNIILLFAIVSLFSFGIIFMINQKIDRDTTVKVEEKILIIEIDDYWNLQDTEAFFDSFGYNMETFRAVSDIIDKYDFVASLGVTPYIFVEENRQNYYLGDDPIMVEYLEELNDKGYELAMHGYNHCRNSNYCPKYEEIWFNVFTGREKLQYLFLEEFMTYFPPGNYWTTEQYENVKRAGFKIIGNTHVPKAYFDEEVIITPKGYDPIYHYGWYQKDFKHTPVEEWIDAYDKSNLFILQLHCNTFDSEEKLDDLDTFLKYVKEDGAKVMTYESFYEYVMEKSKNKDFSITGKVTIK